MKGGIYFNKIYYLIFYNFNKAPEKVLNMSSSIFLNGQTIGFNKEV